MGTRYTTTKLQTGLSLVDYDRWHDDYGRPYICMAAGDTVDVRVEVMEDGRVYYTAFTTHEGHIYSSTKMFDPETGNVREGVGAPFCHRDVVQDRTGPDGLDRAHRLHNMVISDETGDPDRPANAHPADWRPNVG